MTGAGDDRMSLVRARSPSALAAPVLALVVAAVVASLVLLVTGDDVGGFWDVLLDWPQDRNIVNILNPTAILYLSGVAAAIGFRMNLFNIGVEGQYRIAALRRGRLRRRRLAAGPARTPSSPSWSRWWPARCGPASPASCGSPAGSAR